MKKFILLPIILLGLFGIYANVMASPFLVCDPQSDVEHYEVFKDGILLDANVQPDSTGQYGFKYDLQGITPAQYEFTVKACNTAWGCSPLSDPYVSPSPANKPSGLEMIP